VEAWFGFVSLLFWFCFYRQVFVIVSIGLMLLGGLVSLVLVLFSWIHGMVFLKIPSVGFVTTVFLRHK